MTTPNQTQQSTEPSDFEGQDLADAIFTEYTLVDANGDGVFDFIIDRGDLFYGLDENGDGTPDAMEDWTYASPTPGVLSSYQIGTSAALPDADDYFGADNAIPDLHLIPSGYTEQIPSTTADNNTPPGPGGEAPGCPGGPDGHSYGEAWG